MEEKPQTEGGVVLGGRRLVAIDLTFQPLVIG